MGFTVNVEYIGTQYFTAGSTPEQVMEAYRSQIEQISGVWEQLLSGDPASIDMFNTLESARQTLLQYAQEGINIGGDANSPLNRRMGEATDILMKMFRLAGFEDGITTNQVAYVEKWFSLAPAGLGEYIADALAAADSGRSIQALIEMDYIRAGNDLITNKLSDLDEALQATQAAVKLLTDLQAIHNKVTPIDTGDYAAPNNNTTPETYVEDVKEVGEGGSTLFHGFNDPIPLEPTLTSADITNWNTIFTTTLPNLITTLTSDPINAPTGEGTLVDALQQVLDDMTAANDTPATGLTGAETWVIDGFGPTVEDINNLRDVQGDFNRNLTAAQVASQALNDQQKEDVRRTLFLFEEFYKSASIMLQTLMKIFEKMNQNIAR